MADPTERNVDSTRFQEGESSSEPGDGLPRVGEVVGDRFRIDRVLGVGGMGTVLAVTHTTLNEPYALKVLMPHRASDPETVARFMREARSAARIKSEHVAAVTDVGLLPNKSPFILMEYLTGSDLSDVLSQRGPPPVVDAVGYVMQACAGVAEAHALGIVHRDLKPSNLFLTKRSDGEPLVKVLDFGIAKTVTPEEVNDVKLTETRAVFGSPAYMSPEQVRSARKVDFRTDVWSLGIILYELLTKELPFEAESAAGLLAAIAADVPKGVCQKRPDVSVDLEAVILKCLEKDVTKRYQTIADLAADLESFVSGAPISVGRLRRLSIASSRSPSMVPIEAARTSSAPAVGSVTGAPWTTGPHRRGNSSRVLFAGMVIVTLVAVGYAVLQSRKPAAVATPQPIVTQPAPPPEAAPLPAPVVTTTPPPAASTVTEEAPKKPTAVTRGPAAKPANPKKPDPAAPTPPPPTAAPPASKPPDPTADSH